MPTLDDVMNISRLNFNEIVHLYQQPVYWYIRRVVLIHEDAEDILQETFIKAYKRMWQLREKDALKGWLYAIATNEIRRYFKSHRDNVPMEILPSEDLADSESVSANNVCQIISSALLEMTPLQREVFSLRYYDNMDYDSIAIITGSNKNTLMVSYHEARKKIEKEINK